MKVEVVSLPVLFFLSSVAGCSDDDGSEPGPSMNAGNSAGANSSGSGAVCQAGSATTGDLLVVANQANNYSFSSTLSFPTITVAPDTELSFDWSALSNDFLGQPLDPLADIDTVNLTLWTLTEQDLETNLNNDDLEQRDLAVIATIFTEQMVDSATLFDFTSVGLPLTPDQILPFVNAESYDPATHTYTLIAATGVMLGQGTRMIQAFKLDPTTDNTDVVMSNASTVLDYTVDLGSLQNTQIPADNSDITFDWSLMTTNALGNEFVLTSVDQAVVARYSRTPAELEADFLSLVRFDGSIVADELWQGEVPSGTSVVLSALTNETGEPFTGIDDTGTWLVALFCGACQNPAPWYLSLLTPCTP